MEDALEPAEITQKGTILFWFLLIQGAILTVTGIILGDCYEAYQTAATL